MLILEIYECFIGLISKRRTLVDKYSMETKPKWDHG